MELDDPAIDFVGLARSLGVPAAARQDLHDATDLIAKGLAGNSPMLINVAIAREFKITRPQTRIARMAEQLLPTTVVGSYPQPDWLVDRERARSRRPCRACALQEIWRVPEHYLEQAQDDATLIAIRDMERAGIDIITDGEIRRESYSNRFATALDGIDIDNPGDGARPRGRRHRRCRASSARSAGAAPVEVRDMRVPAPQHRPRARRSRCPARSR